MFAEDKIMNEAENEKQAAENEGNDEAAKGSEDTKEEVIEENKVEDIEDAKLDEEPEEEDEAPPPPKPKKKRDSGYTKALEEAAVNLKIADDTRQRRVRNLTLF